MTLEEKYLESITFHQIFHNVAKQYGELICLYDEKYYSYKQISKKVNVVASYLKNNFAEGTKIGLYFVQSIDYIVSFLAVMQAGCTSVPVSGLNHVPLERLKQYLNCGVQCVLTTRELQQNIYELYLDILVIEQGNIVKQLNTNSKTYNINTNYRYDPEDVLGILRSRVQTIDVNNVYTPGLEWVIGNHDISLAEYLAYEKRQCLRKNYTNNRTLLIPYRVSSIHWVGILININQNFTVDKIIIVDAAKISFCQSIVIEAIRSCANVYKCLETIAISQQEHKLIQHDFTSCGPLVVENLLLAAGIKAVNDYLCCDYISLVYLIRRIHIDYYKKQIYFAKKQSNAVNISLEQLLRQLGKKIFNADEKCAIVEAILTIQKNKKYNLDLIQLLLKKAIVPDKLIEAQEWIKFVLYNQSLQSQQVQEKTYIKLFDLIMLFINKQKIRSSAYILNTSGSTGVPKKIAIEHDGLPFCMRSSHDFLKIAIKDKISAFADISFDAHIFDIMMALGKGASLYIVPSAIRTDTIRLGQFYSFHKITITVLTPSMLQTLEPKNFPDLRVLLSTGEVLDSGIIKSWKNFNNNILFINGYGPSEVTIATTMGICEVNQPPHIGRPILGLEIFILEREPKDPKAPIKVVDGEEGELYITGRGVSKLGYIDNPELTNERFVEISHPDDKSKKIKCFRTRDLAKVDANSGLIMIVGRIDRQFKINGKLCCPEEIESHIKTGTNNITRVYVNINEVAITAYIQLDCTIFNHNTHSLQHMVNFLYEKISKTLPNYMLPSRWIFTDSIKLNNSGKIDINDILLLEKDSMMYFPRNTLRVLPSNAVQRKISNIFRETLNVGPLIEIYVDDNFYKLGANSLQLEMLFTKIRQQFQIDILPLQRQKILQEPTVINIERQINCSKISLSTDENKNLNIITFLNPVDLADSDPRPAIFLIHSVMGDATQDYYKITPCLKDFRLFGVSYPRLSEENFDSSDITLLVNQYIKYIKSIQPKGPYFIIGWSLGGLIALEIIANLENHDEIAHAVMLDPILWSPAQLGHHHAKNLISLFNHIKEMLKLQKVNLTIQELTKCNSKKEQILLFAERCCSAIYQNNVIVQLKVILSIKNLLLSMINYDPDITLINSNSIIVAQQSFNLYARKEFNILPSLHERPFFVEGDHFEILNNNNTYTYIKQEYVLVQQIVIFSYNIINVLPEYLNNFDIVNNVYNICKLLFDYSYLNLIVYANINYPDACYKIFLKMLLCWTRESKQANAIMCYKLLQSVFANDPLMYVRSLVFDPEEHDLMLYLDHCLYDILSMLCSNFRSYDFPKFVRDCRLDDRCSAALRDFFITENPSYLSINNLSIANGENELSNTGSSIGHSDGYEQSEFGKSEYDFYYSDSDFNYDSDSSNYLAYNDDLDDGSEAQDLVDAFSMLTIEKDNLPRELVDIVNPGRMNYSNKPKI